MVPRKAIVAALIVALLAPALALAGPDLNNDGKIDHEDFRILMNGWRRYKLGLGEWGEADVNSDGVIDYTDACMLIEAYLAQALPSVQLANYLPAAEGDMRLFHGRDGLIEAVQTLEDCPLQADFVEEKIVDMFNDMVSDLIWRVAGGHLAALAGWMDENGALYQVFPPDQGAALPETLTKNVPATVEFDVYKFGQKVGEGSLTLTLLALNQSVTTGAGTFDKAIKVRVQLQWTDNGDEHNEEMDMYLAPGVGEVRRDMNPGQPDASSWMIAYAEVGGQSHGTRPKINVAADFPAPQGALFIWRRGDELHGVRALAQKPVGGQASVPLARLMLPLGIRSLYWAVNGSGNIKGIAGWRLYAPSDCVLSPVFTWPDVMPLGHIEAREGSVEYQGNVEFGTYKASCAIVGTGRSVDTPAGTFDGCHVYCLRIEAHQPSGDLLMLLRQRMWIKPGFGPVKVEHYEPVVPVQWPTPDSTSVLVYGRNGAQKFGTQPTVDYAGLLKLAPGNCWRLFRTGGWWQVTTVVGETTVLGIAATEVLTARSGGGGFSDMSSDYWRVSPGAITLVATRPDPDEAGADTLWQPNPQPSIPRPLAMGDPVQLNFNLIDTASGQPVATIDATVLYSSQTDVSCPAGDFSGVHEIQFHTVFTPAGGGEPDEEVECRQYDSNAGLVGTWVMKDIPDDIGFEFWKGEWARVGSSTWNYPGTFDIATYYALATGNAWRYGNPADYVHREVGAQTSVGSFHDAFPVSRWESHDPAEVDIFYRVVQTGALRLVAFKPSDYPNVVFYETPVDWPRPWYMGVLARTETNLVDPNQPALAVPVRELVVPVDAGVGINTPAGHFDNCVRLAILRVFDLQSIGEDVEWEHVDMILAPNMGPVRILERAKDEEEYWGPGELFWAIVDGTEYGNQ